MHVEIKDDGQNVLLEVELIHNKGTKNPKRAFGIVDAYHVLVTTIELRAT
jgi:hypothetical protein